jgi:VIT1/CCC1 family predicted Fe2+/Mn2+ transporter
VAVRVNGEGHFSILHYAWQMVSIVVSTIAYFVAAFFIKQWLDGMDFPKGMTRSLVIFVGAAVVSYGVAFAVDLFVT